MQPTLSCNDDREKCFGAAAQPNQFHVFGRRFKAASIRRRTASEVWRFDVEPDELTLADLEEADEEEELAQLANLFFYLDSSHRGEEYAQPITNSAGATTWLRLNDISLKASSTRSTARASSALTVAWLRTLSKEKQAIACSSRIDAKDLLRDMDRLCSVHRCRALRKIG
jgi:hypothetical protein